MSPVDYPYTGLHTFYVNKNPTEEEAEAMAEEGRQESSRCTFSQKWGDDPFTQMGYTQVPNALVQYAARLQLKSEECWLICCVLKFKFDASNPCPKQEDLAGLFGQSVDTVQRTAKKIVAKKLLRVEHMRGEQGRFTHMVYDFTPLRYALNECYYADHPQEKPQVPMPNVSPTPQKRGMETAPAHTAEMRRGDEKRPHRTFAAPSTPQKCGVDIYKDSRVDSQTLLNQKQTNSSRTRADAAMAQPLSSAAAALVELLTAQDVNRADAIRFALEKPEECQRQLDYLPYVTEFRSSKGAYLRSAIENDYGAPKAYRDVQQQAQKSQKRTRIHQSRTEVSRQKQAKVEAARRQAQADPHAWEAIVAEAKQRMPKILRDRPQNPSYEPALQACIDTVIAEREIEVPA